MVSWNKAFETAFYHRRPQPCQTILFDDLLRDTLEPFDQIARLDRVSFPKVYFHLAVSPFTVYIGS